MTGEVPLLWFVARASGLTAYAFLTITVVLGIAAGARGAPGAWPRFATQGLHRAVSATALFLLALHVVTLVLDPYVVLGWLDVVVPFRAGHERIWSGLGTLAVDVLLLVVVTTAIRARLGPRGWRAAHATAYAAWALALLHGLGAGTDTQHPLVRAAYAVSFGVVFGATVVRAARRPVRSGVRLLSDREVVR